MSLEFSHKPNYFFFAQTLVNFLGEQLRNQPITTKTYALADIYHLFRQDFAATTANLESILNIADGYRVQDQPFIEHYHINAEANTVSFNFNPAAAQAVAQGAPITAPDAVDYD